MEGKTVFTAIHQYFQVSKFYMTLPPMVGAGLDTPSEVYEKT